ncbi:MAG: GNAT family N-acetyltransferase [Actinomycetota bacterium]|nr:GNAT family N-acetyltransferase [Actinomycetota bacterium]
MIEVRRLSPDDEDLATVAGQLNDPVWEDFDNRFSLQSLRDFVEDEDRVYLVAYIGEELVGAAHAYVMQHPTGWKHLYIDEIDTAKPHRRRGVATRLMNELLRLAREVNANEAWLGVDEGNDAGYALYRKLGPSGEERGAIFTYEIV